MIGDLIFFVFRMYELPVMLCGAAATLLLMFGVCAFCRCSCRCRDLWFIRRCLRAAGHDEFDDFELTVMVHEVIFDRSVANLPTMVRITAGTCSAITETSSNGNYQQPLTVNVEQGSPEVLVELVDASESALALLRLDVMRDVLGSRAPVPESVIGMRAKSSKVRNPRIKLTLQVTQDDDLEASLDRSTNEVDWLVRQQLSKVGGADAQEQDALKAACSGPLELFEGMGGLDKVYVSILGPPSSRRWALGVWRDKNDFDRRGLPTMEVDMLRVRSVQADPTRSNVFVMNYFDEHRVSQRLRFRRVDRARDVWVELLQRVITKIHESRKDMKVKRTVTGGGVRPTQSGASMSSSAASFDRVVSRR